jgi:ElaB/YqjD/DUF883 family membrane-anchored ribosome-binding protein
MSTNNDTNETPADVADERPRESLGHRAGRAREQLADVVDEQVRSARRAIRKGKYAAEDLADEVRLEARRNPLQTVGVALGIGAIAGLIAGLALRGAPRRRPRI